MLRGVCSSTNLFTLCLHVTPHFFFFYHTPTTEIYTLSLHDALPISRSEQRLDDPAHRPGVEVALVPVQHLVEARGHRMLVVGEQHTASAECGGDPGGPAAQVGDERQGSPGRVDDVEAAAPKLDRQLLNVC